MKKNILISILKSVHTRFKTQNKETNYFIGISTVNNLWQAALEAQRSSAGPCSVETQSAGPVGSMPSGLSL